MTELQEYTLFTALFNPKDVDTLKPTALPLIGRRFTFRAEWIIENGEQYAGDWACTLQDKPPGDLDWVWLPSRDLDDIRILTSEVESPHAADR
jgi:hypothetical protein